jgi:hypothetical protein
LTSMTLTSNCGKSYYVRYFFKKYLFLQKQKNESFLTSCSTSKNNVLTYIFNDLTSKVGPRRPSVAPISPGRGKKLASMSPPPAPISCRSRAIQSAGVAGSGSLALSIRINHTAHRCRRIPETAALYNIPISCQFRAIQSAGERGLTISLPRRNKLPGTPGKVGLIQVQVIFRYPVINKLFLIKTEAAESR